MRIKNYFKLGSFLFAIAALTACGDDSSSSASDDSSSSVASFRSSSSLSTRADIDYKDTVNIGDTALINIELFKGDSSKMDPKVLYLDSSAIDFPLYLGEFTKGTRIRVYASTSNIGEDRIRVKSEFGEYLQALTAVARNETRKDSVFDNYLVASLGTDTTATLKDSNQFVVFNDNHYFLEVSGDFNNKSNLRLKVLVDSAYYEYTGDEENISIGMNDTLRGIVDIDKSPEKISIAFSGKEGYSINLNVKGKNISAYKFSNGKELLGDYKSSVDTMLIPTDSVNWKLDISPENFSNFQTGPFAFFEAKTKSRELEQGEYFSFPDSIEYPGEYFVRTRPKDDIGIYKYNLLQEQFVWLGDYKKGDSILVSHHIENYNDYNTPVTCEILDKKQKVQSTISCVYGGAFAIKDKMPEGPYYLHYKRLKSDPLDQGLKHDSLRYVLQLFTMVQQPGILKTFKFYDPEKDAAYDKSTLSVGDSIRLKDIQFLIEASSKSNWNIIGSDVSWYIPCESLDYINNSSRIYKSSSCNTEQEISSDYLIAFESGISKTAELIAQSVADPAKRDTLKISIIAKAN